MNEIETWERVAGELAEELHRLRRILLGLAEVLPPQYLPYLDTEFNSAGELAEELHRLRRILLGLAELLPPQYLPYLDTEFNSAAGTFDALTGWDETAVITSDVITELEALWQRVT